MKTTLKGTVDSIRYRNPDNGWTVVMLSTGEKTLRAVVGVLPDLREGMTVEVEGIITSSKYGEQLRAESWTEVRPTDAEGIEKYLASGLIKNIGPAFARLIVKQFGDKTLDVLDNDPQRLLEIKGVGQKRVESVIESVRQQKAIRGIMIWLKRYDLPNGLSTKIWKTYGDDAIAVIEQNPYRLADEMDGVAFKTADRVALATGTQKDSPLRIYSALRYVLQDASVQGNTCLSADDLVERTASADMLDLDPGTVRAVLAEVSSSERPRLVKVRCEGTDYVYLPWLLRDEKAVAARLAELSRPMPLEGRVDIAYLERKTGVQYADEQADGIRTALSHGLTILTGGPGTGKTVTTKAIITALEDAGAKVRLTAPTGRAAKRLAEVTGREAKTIHRLLEYCADGFSRCADFPLEGDALVVDESSMIDIQLMASLLDAVPQGMRVVLVGDVDQLPSVGPGSVLRDAIDSGMVPTVRLRKIFRQAQNSDIVMNAHAINEGKLPHMQNRKGTDFWMVKRDSQEEISATIDYLVSTHLPKMGFRRDDIQVLCPMRKDSDPIGASRLNALLQEKLNPVGDALTYGNLTFRCGDRVMQIRNDYDKNVFNGDVGRIVRVDVEEGKIHVDYAGQEVVYEKKELDELDLAYATTVHKSQGSEYPVVVMPVHRSQWVMLVRNLLYTGVTRAKRLCVLVGTTEAVAMAVGREDTTKRCSLLKNWLCEES